MNIHCSACGAPLPQGSKFCPACALPLTALAVPTPVQQRRRVSLLAIAAAAFGIFWLVAYTSDQVAAAHHQPQAAATPALTATQIKTAAAIDERYEREIDAEIWNSPTKLRERVVLLSLSTDPAAKHTITRLEARVRQLRAQ